jgi:uncharacterized protein (DUF427 family)
VYYLPFASFTWGAVVPVEGTTFCEFKGTATYFDLVGGDRRARRPAWTYEQPAAGLEAIYAHLAVMPGLVDRCTVDGEVVVPQDGGFYGGWITSRVVGPFKGGPGTLGW